MENTTKDQIDYIKGVIEAILFVSERPVALDELKKALETVGAAEIKSYIQALQQEQEQRKSGMTIVEIAEGYQMLSNPTYAAYLHNFYKTKHKEKLSKPALETIAIVAYKQPVTRADIEVIRGVNSDGVVAHLLNKELIKVVGRKDIPGKPFLYGTTKQFLEYFGLKSLSDLPRLEEFPTLQPPQGETLPVNEEELKEEEAAIKESVEALAQAASSLEKKEIEQKAEESTPTTGESQIPSNQPQESR